MSAWDTAKPYVEALSAIVAVPLSVGNLLWLLSQARRAKETDRIAREAHEWARERGDPEQKQTAAEEARHAWLREMADRVKASPYGVDLPEGIDRAWVAEGEQKKYFRLAWVQPGKYVLRKPFVK